MTPAGRCWTLLGPDGRPVDSEVPGTLGGHRRSRIYGRLDCPSALRAIARGGYVRHRVFFADEATAIGAGYRPCGACMRERQAAWKAERGTRESGGPVTDARRAENPHPLSLSLRGEGQQVAKSGSSILPRVP